MEREHGARRPVLTWGDRLRAMAPAAVVALVLAAWTMLSPGWRLVLVGVAVALPACAWAWRHTAARHRRLDHALAPPAMAAFGGLLGGFLAEAFVGAPIVVAVVALGLLGRELHARWTRHPLIDALDDARARGDLAATSLPDDGDATREAWFVGEVHPIGAPTCVPGTTLPVAAWSIRQGARAWSSVGGFELRAGGRTVRADLAEARTSGSRWTLQVRRDPAIVEALPGVRPDEAVAVWTVAPGERALVIGTPTREPDPRAEALRDAPLRFAFTGPTLVVRALDGLSLRLATPRAIAWGVVAIGALALALLR